MEAINRLECGLTPQSLTLQVDLSVIHGEVVVRGGDLQTQNIVVVFEV